MKRSLLAMAAMMAVAGVASAQSSVNIGGIVDLAARSVKNPGGEVKTLSPEGAASNRLIFRGVEDMGGGLRASFWLEAAIAPDTGGGSANVTPGATPGGLTWTRRSTVSLSGGWGEIRLGRDYTPTFWTHTLFDPYNTVGVAAQTNLMTTPAGALATTLVRADNMIGYFLPGGPGWPVWPVQRGCRRRPHGQQVHRRPHRLCRWPAEHRFRLRHHRQDRRDDRRRQGLERRWLVRPRLREASVPVPQLQVRRCRAEEHGRRRHDSAGRQHLQDHVRQDQRLPQGHADRPGATSTTCRSAPRCTPTSARSTTKPVPASPPAHRASPRRLRRSPAASTPRVTSSAFATASDPQPMARPACQLLPRPPSGGLFFEPTRSTPAHREPLTHTLCRHEPGGHRAGAERVHQHTACSALGSRSARRSQPRRLARRRPARQGSHALCRGLQGRPFGHPRPIPSARPACGGASSAWRPKRWARSAFPGGCLRCRRRPAWPTPTARTPPPA